MKGVARKQVRRKQLAIVDWRMGNIGSVVNALEYIGCHARLTCNKDELRKSDGIILPGVGAFENAMENLKALDLIRFLAEQVIEKKKPFLGICLGMQVLGVHSEENGFHKGLGWLGGPVKRLTVQKGLRLPHMGWNDVRVKEQTPLFEGMSGDRNFYFVHSYHLICDPTYVVATCCYGEEFSAVVQKDNIVGTQFHPERSHTNGLQFLRNFVQLALIEKEASAC